LTQVIDHVPERQAIAHPPMQFGSGVIRVRDMARDDLRRIVQVVGWSGAMVVLMTDLFGAPKVFCRVGFP